MPGHPTGLLAYRHSNSCALRSHEDGQLVADLERELIRFTRPSTMTERIQLAAAGYVVPDDPEPDPDNPDDPVVNPLQTHIEYVTPAVRLRTWPGLKLAETTEATA